MGAKAVFGPMIVGSVVVMFVAAARHPEAAAPAPVPRPHERPWLTPEAAAEIVGPDGGPGPLFAGVTLGGPAPSPEVRARIADFARANSVDIRFEVAAGELAAIRFAVTFGGCCGYEGADSLGRRLQRPRTSRCCGCEREWIDDWAYTLDSGTHVHARVHVNHVEVHWEPSLSIAELLDRADGLVGQTRASVRASAGDRWTELEFEHRYALEVPFAFMHGMYEVAFHDDLGLELDVEHGKIAQVSLALRDVADADALAAALRARWGRPRIVSKEHVTWSWRKADRTVTAELEGDPTQIVIRAR